MEKIFISFQMITEYKYYTVNHSRKKLINIYKINTVKYIIAYCDKNIKNLKEKCIKISLNKPVHINTQKFHFSIIFSGRR